jgi:hypothetical protein
MTHTDPKDEMKKFEEKNRSKREGLSGKQAARKLDSAKEASKADKWAKRQIKRREAKDEAGKQRQKYYKKRQKKERKEYEEFREKKDAEANKLIETKAKRMKDREAQLQYLKEMSIRNRWQIMRDKREDEVENIKKKSKLEADRGAKRKKLDADSEERRAKKNTEKVARKDRGAADIYEKDHTERIRKEARAQQQKLKIKERTEEDQLDGKILRQRAIAESYANPMQKRTELRKVSTMEERERKKVRMKYIKLEQDTEVDANKDIQIVKKEAHKMHSKASMGERKSKLQLEETTRRKKRRADKNASQKKKTADDAEKEMMADLPVMPTGDEE